MLTALALSSSLVIATCVTVVPSAPAAPASPLVHWRPLAWTPPAAECGAQANDLGMPPVRARSVEGEVQSLPDVRAAARAAIVGGALRAYMIATFDADGVAQASCVGSLAEALRSVAEANTRPAAQAT